MNGSSPRSSRTSRTRSSTDDRKTTGIRPDDDRKMNTLNALFGLMTILPLLATGRGGPSPDTLPAPDEMVLVSAGSYLPHYSRGRERVEVPAFEIDPVAVTRQEYLAFVTAN